MERHIDLHGFVQFLFQHQKPKLTFDPGRIDSRDAFDAWQTAVRARLRHLCRFPEPMPQPPPRKIWAKGREGYRIEKWELYPEAGSTVPFLALIPNHVTAESPAPAVMCFPGTADNKETLSGEPHTYHIGGRGTDSWRFDGNPHAAAKAKAKALAGPRKLPRFENRMAWHVVRQGFVAITVDNPGVGEPNLPHERPPAFEMIKGQLIRVGRNYAGLSAFQKLAVFEWALTQAWIDGRRIAVCGHSLGAIPALLMAVLEPRICALVWNDHCDYQRIRCGATGYDTDSFKTLPPWLTDRFYWFDTPDLLAAVAPRPVLISEATDRTIEPVIRHAYSLFGRADQFHAHPHPALDTSAPPADNYPPEPGETMSLAEYFGRQGVDYRRLGAEHYFKRDVVLPWIRGVFEGGRER